MKHFALILFFAVASFAQTITVSGDVEDAMGGAAVGTVTISWPNFNYSGTVVTAGSRTYRPTAGAISVVLYPGTYTVVYRLVNGNVTTVKWIVPASPSTRTIAEVQTAFIAPNIPAPIPFAQGGTGVTDLTASKCVQVNSTGDGLEAATDACGTASIPASVQTGTSYTVVSGDKGKALFFTNASAVTVTVPAASTITGSVIIVSKGAGGVTVQTGFTAALFLNDFLILVSDGTTWRNVNQIIRVGNGQQASTTGAITTHNISDLLQAIAALASNGMIVRTSSTTAAARTITGTSNEVCVADGDGASANPTLSVCATFDVSGKTSTKPMKSGTSVPGTCAVGEMFFDTDATAGQNIYGCTAINTWTLQAGGGGSGSTAETYCVPSVVSNNLQISTPCQVLFGNVTLTYGSNMTFDASSGSGNVFFGIQDGLAKAWHDVTATCTNATCVAATSAPPVDACLVATATVTSGVVSAPVNVLLGRACFRTTSSSSITTTCDPATGVCQLDTVVGTEVYVGQDAGANDTYTFTPSPAPGAYTAGMLILFKANTANTGAATVNVNSLGAKTIKKVAGGVTTDLADNDIRAGQWVLASYDGTNMQMLSQLGNAASGGGVALGTEAFTANGTFTPATGVTWVWVEAWSGGSGGCGANFDTDFSCGGGGGGYWLGMCAVTPGVGVTVTIGAGGAGGTGGGDPSVGGDTSFGSCFTVTGARAGVKSTGAGGAGGYKSTLGSSYGARSDGSFQPASAGGSVSPMWMYNGGTGATGSASAVAGGMSPFGGGGGGEGGATGGAGGASGWGGSGGAGGISTGTPCAAGTAPGGGGGGNANAGGSTTGCAGARGEVRVWW